MTEEAQRGGNQLPSLEATVVIFTDGACVGNPGPGGYAAVLRRGKSERVVVGGADDTTNNAMELMAALKALEATSRGRVVIVQSDSEYLVKGMTTWVAEWKARGWKTAAKKPVKNRELWERLDAVTSERAVSWEWVRGHNGHPMNERVDQLAEDEARRRARGIGWTPRARLGFIPVE